MAQKRTVFLGAGVGLLVVVLGVLGFTLWFAYHSSQVANRALNDANKVAQGDAPKAAPITSFEDCKLLARGSKILETYPEQCVTAGGKTFTDAGQKYLVITEWGVKLPLTAAAKDTYYFMSPSYTDGVRLSLTSLKDTECSAEETSLGAIERFQAGDTFGTDNETILSKSPSSPKVGKYYYHFVSPQAACDSGKVQLPKDVNLKTEWSQALKQIQAN